MLLLSFSYYIGNFVPYVIKTLRVDRTAADRKRSLMRPAAGGESCKAGFFLVITDGSQYISSIVQVRLFQSESQELLQNSTGSLKSPK